MHDLVFSVQPSLVGRNIERLRQQVLKRDEHRCQFCGLCSLNGMDVVYANDKYETTLDGCATACAVCASVLRGGVHAGSNSGYMVLMPELKQVEVVGLFLAMSAWSDIAVTVKQQPLRAIAEQIDARRGQVEEVTGVTRSFKVSHWRQLLSSPKFHANRARLLGPFRFMPDHDCYVHELKAWSKEVFQRYDEKSIQSKLLNLKVKQ
ncbi:hypothetical protein [Reinekea sp. G2M2-21]|uniref:hypothetical protein n=1 Tax=Reinekea sp. G2M2-21 TaxID=2788942 RepID=UPI0018AC3A66|nr:hypothetical protein [Reinekea sp. G2M2-21]